MSKKYTYEKKWVITFQGYIGIIIITCSLIVIPGILLTLPFPWKTSILITFVSSILQLIWGCVIVMDEKNIAQKKFRVYHPDTPVAIKGGKNVNVTKTDLLSNPLD